jgi:hypothetical protein
MASELIGIGLPPSGVKGIWVGVRWVRSPTPALTVDWAEPPVPLGLRRRMKDARRLERARPERDRFEPNASRGIYRTRVPLAPGDLVSRKPEPVIMEEAKRRLRLIALSGVLAAGIARFRKEEVRTKS